MILSVVSLIWSSAGYFWPRRDLRILGCLWITHHLCICKLNWTKMLCLSRGKQRLYEFRFEWISTKNGAQFVPIRIPTVCWKTFPAKTTKILSNRNSIILMISSSEYLFLESGCFFINYVSKCLIPNSLKMKAFRIIPVSLFLF